MTQHQKLTDQTDQNNPVSLPFDPSTLAQGIRVSQAQFSRMCLVSRQTVSAWSKKGLVRLFPDGTLDPADAARRVLQNTDPARIRAKIFKDSVMTSADWKRRLEVADEALANALARVEYLDGFIDETELGLEMFLPASWSRRPTGSPPHHRQTGEPYSMRFTTTV